MFKNILIYEWEKFWTKKINMLCYIAIPVIVLLSLRYSLDTNANLKSIDVAYSSFMNFPITSLQEMLITAFNALVVILFILSFHEEYWNGNLRLIFMRPVKKNKIYLAKFFVLIINIALFLLIQFLVSFLLGFMFLPHESRVGLYFKKGIFGANEVLLFSAKYYLGAFLSLIAFGALIEIVSMLCKTIAGAIGGSFAALFISGFYIVVVNQLISGKSIDDLLASTYYSGSLLYTEAKGLAYFAGGITNIFLYVLILKILVYKYISYMLFTKRDYME